tara:strand:+ start:784 stop:1392 length:609 start_codon:yes stop_codon:yes gene_type:complete
LVISRFPAIEECVNAFAKLPGIGPKSAQRIVFHLLSKDTDLSKLISSSCDSLIAKISLCPRCSMLVQSETDADSCRNCFIKDPPQICIVENHSDVFAIQRTGNFRGSFHVLMGLISPLDGTEPEDLTISLLIERIKSLGTKEVILALNPNMAGEGTSLYLSKILKPLGVKISKLARGIPMGSQLEYADEITLSRSIEDRTEL